jgi:putative oxidoreductase
MTTPSSSSSGLRGLVLGTSPGFTPVLLRLTLAAVMFPHGAQKALGWFGGGGWTGTMGYLTGTAGLPTALAALVILIEFLGPIALVLGFLTRPAALGFIALMLGAIQKVHLANGFFMNWTGQQKGEGYEYHLLVIGIALALLFAGGGGCSLDRRLSTPRAA